MLATYLNPILSPLTSNEFTVKNYFNFAEEVVNYDHNLYMASLDVESLFTNIPLEETINPSCIMSQNRQTHFKNLAANSAQILKYV